VSLVSGLRREVGKVDAVAVDVAFPAWKPHAAKHSSFSRSRGRRRDRAAARHTLPVRRCAEGEQSCQGLIFRAHRRDSGSYAESSCRHPESAAELAIGVPLPACVRNWFRLAVAWRLRRVPRLRSGHGEIAGASFPVALAKALLQIAMIPSTVSLPSEQAKHVGPGAGGHPLLVGELAVRRRGGMDDQALHRRYWRRFEAHANSIDPP